jgi:hypothetical protein
MPGGAGLPDKRRRTLDGLLSVLFTGPSGRTATHANAQRHCLEIDRAIDLVSPLELLLRPEVEPWSAWQVQPAARSRG